MWQTIVLVRHAEKPTERERGVDEQGLADPNSLTVRGWQRAGALASFFGRPELPTPHRIFATANTSAHPSKRCWYTVLPLSRRCGIEAYLAYGIDQESQLAAHVARMPGVTLVVWEHRGLSLLLAALLSEPPQSIRHWPEGRFDLIWLLQRQGVEAPWQLSRQAQLLLPGDLR